MSALRPFPFAALLRRLRAELEGGGPVFGLPRRDWHRPRRGLDLSFVHGGGRAANPLGPAAGPHTQLAPNIVQGWLAGARVFELKTIQERDDLEIARPCIHAPHYGLNTEWSQELRLADSVREYLKAAWMLEILRRTRAGGELAAGADLDTVVDISVGYSLAGIRGPSMTAALGALREPAAGYAELRGSLPPDLRAWAGEPPAGPAAAGVTLSTFHGCPPAEVEAIAGHLLDGGWHVSVKLNPTLLGLDEVRRLLHDVLGYRHLEPDEEAFARDLDLPAAVALLRRLRARAARLGLTAGAKLTNTLVLRRDPALFPAAAGPHMYLSGAPLHPLALATAARVAAALPAALPLSFSAGIDQGNAAGVLACGLAPLTLCTDLLRRGGQGRLSRVLAEVERRLLEAGCPSLAEWQGGMDGRPPVWRETVRRLEETALGASEDPRHTAVRVMRPPPRRPRRLERLDCLSCDLCLPVCPNGALFAWASPGGQGLAKPAQIGVLADACNACGHCEAWCPEEGAPWRVKERWHQDAAALAASPPDLDGCCLEDGVLLARFGGRHLCLSGDPELLAGRLEVDGQAWTLAASAFSGLPPHLEEPAGRARLVWLGLAHGTGHPVALMREGAGL